MIEFIEHTGGYAARTRENAKADATIAIAVDFTTAGEKLTKKAVKDQCSKYIPIDGNSFDITASRVFGVVSALNEARCRELNIAGNGLHTVNGMWTQLDMDEFVYWLLKAVVENPGLHTPITRIRTGGQTGIDEAGAKAGLRLGIPTTVLAPKGWTFRNKEGKDISDERMFKARFKTTMIDVAVEPLRAIALQTL